MSAVAHIPDYAAVLAKHPPKVIRTEDENEYYTSILKELDERFDHLNEAERDFADLLTLLIEDFESKHYELPKAAPLDVIRFLMDQHRLKQRDLLDIFGNAIVTPQEVSGKRNGGTQHLPN